MSKPNYTAEQVSVIENAAALAPINSDVAATIAAEIGKSKRSVIAKVKSLGLDYVVTARATKGVRDVTKADLVSEIALALGLDSSKLKGLEKATAAALKVVLSEARDLATVADAE